MSHVPLFTRPGFVLRQIVLLLSALLLVGLLVPGSASHAAPTRRFDPGAFFSGKTVGDARIKIIMRSAHGMHVESTGKVEADGTLSVTQVVEEEGKPMKKRAWRIREVSPGRYEGTLSDAVGPVTGTLENDVLRLRFAIKGGMKAENVLRLRADGQSVHNVMTVRKFGITVATLDETIRRVGN